MLGRIYYTWEKVSVQLMSRCQKNFNNKIWSFILHFGTSGEKYKEAHNFKVSLDVKKRKKQFTVDERHNIVS